MSAQVPVLERLETIAEELRAAEAAHPPVSWEEKMVLWRRRRTLIAEAQADGRRQTDIARALGVSRERVRQITMNVG